MLEIDANRLIGKGLHRECFVHPGNPDWCVKIVVAGNSNENHREAKYYRWLEKRGISWEMLTRFHGLKETNLGEGAVFDLVRDDNGDVSKTLTHYLDHEELTRANSASLASALTGLKAYLLANAIVTMTLKTKNILFQKTTRSDGKLVIVDNVGNSDFIPITNYSNYLACLKIGRKWRRFEHSIRAQHVGNRALPTLLD